MGDELIILWTNADEVTFDKMVRMYAANSLRKNWWEKVTIIIWGHTASLTAESGKVQEGIRELQEVGVKISACKACSDGLGVSNTLEGLGIELKYWGEGLTKILKDGQKLLTV